MEDVRIKKVIRQAIQKASTAQPRRYDLRAVVKQVRAKSQASQVGRR